MSEQFLFLAEGAVLRDEDNSDTGWRVHGNNGSGVNLSNTMFFKNDVLDTETYPELDYGPSNWIDWDTTVLDENTGLVTTYGIKDGYEEIFNTVSSAVELSNKNVALDKIYREGFLTKDESDNHWKLDAGFGLQLIAGEGYVPLSYSKNYSASYEVSWTAIYIDDKYIK